MLKVTHLRFESMSFDSRACGLICYPILPPYIPENVTFLGHSAQPGTTLSSSYPGSGPPSPHRPCVLAKVWGLFPPVVSPTVSPWEEGHCQHPLTPKMNLFQVELESELGTPCPSLQGLGEAIVLGSGLPNPPSPP